jgi:hypothetical protein
MKKIIIAFSVFVAFAASSFAYPVAYPGVESTNGSGTSQSRTIFNIDSWFQYVQIHIDLRVNQQLKGTDYRASAGVWLYDYSNTIVTYKYSNNPAYAAGTWYLGSGAYYVLSDIHQAYLYSWTDSYRAAGDFNDASACFEYSDDRNSKI